MSRSTAARVTSVLLALLFVGGLTTEAYGLHACPRHHDGPPPRDSSPHAVVSPDSGPDSDGSDHEFCTCVGSCHGGAATPTPAFGSVTVVGDLPTTSAPPQRRTRIRPRDRAVYFLPFPTGPPPS